MSRADGAGAVLLSAKLNRPRVTKDLVVRPRLLSLLDAGLEGPLTVVVAPAGFGKTTLVSSWIEELAAGKRRGISLTPAVWLSLDESDSDPNVFLRYFISALRTVFRDAAPQTLQLLSASQPPPSNVLIDILSNEIEGLPSSFIMVLDDAHALRGQDVFHCLAAWTRHWPRPMHLVLVSRLNPPLPLANLRGKGKVVEIRPRDLRFTTTETAEYLNRALGSSVREPAPATVHQQMEGWITGIKLITHAPEARDYSTALPQEVLSGEVYVADYLIDEVLLRQPPGIQRFLLTISIAGQFCESLGEALLGDQGTDYTVRQCIEYLETNELFLTGLDNRREWYRLHQILRDLLQRRLRREMGEQAVDDLQLRAARWYAEHGLPDQALHHALEGKSQALAVQIMQQGICDVLNRTDRPMLERWLKMLPGEMILPRPELLVMRAWEYGLRWELAQVQRVVEQAEVLLDETGAAAETVDDAILRGQIAALKGHVAYHAGQPARAVTYCRETLALMPPEWLYVRGVAAMYLGLSLHDDGHIAEAERFLATQYELTADKTDGYALRLIQTLALNALQSGLLETAERTAQVMLRQSNEIGLALLQGWAYYLLGYVHYHWSDLDAAERYFAAAAGLRYATQILVTRNGLIGLATVYQAQGKSAEAMATIDDLGRIDIELYGREDISTAAARARLLLRQGDLEGAEQQSKRIALPPRDQPLLPWAEEPLLTRIGVLIAGNTPVGIDEALNALGAMDEIASRTLNTRSRVELLALRALAETARGNVGSAGQTLIRSVELARRTGQKQLFVDLGLPMQKLLSRIAGHGTVNETVEKILAAFETAGGTGAIGPATRVVSRDGNGSAAAAQALPEQLTARELEVLTLMAEPISLAEIAERLQIASSTTKRHSLNVYEKLGAHRRWEAVARAIELGILPHR